MLEPFIEVSENSVNDFISQVSETKRQLDAQLLQQLMARITGEDAKMWGKEVIGFSSYRNTHKTGRQWDWPVLSFAIEPGRLVIYVMTGFDELEKPLRQLGKHKVSSHCLYIKTLSDIDMNILETLLEKVYADMKAKYAS